MPSSWYKEFMEARGFDLRDVGKIASLTTSPGPMDLANMRKNGVRSIAIYCYTDRCWHQATMNVDAYPDHLAVKSFQPRMKCSKCGGKNVEVRPDWSEKPTLIPSPGPIRR